MGTRKIAVSQRWDSSIVDLVKEGSTRLGISQTQFTVEAIKVYSTLLEDPNFSGLSLERKLEALKGISIGGQKSRTRNENRPPGYIYDLVRKYLESHPNTIMSTNEIAEALQVPQPTVRTYVRKLANEYPQLKLYPGRPNRIEYIP